MPPRQKFIRSSSPRRCSKRPVTRGPTRSIVVRKASTSARSEAAVRRAPMAHLACSSWTARRLTSSAAGRSIVGPKTLIRQAMRGKGMVALGRLVLSKRERVIALEAYDKGLLGTTLRYPYDFRDAKDYFCDLPDLT